LYFTVVTTYFTSERLFIFTLPSDPLLKEGEKQLFGGLEGIKNENS
jgi:hypothetical protein